MKRSSLFNKIEASEAENLALKHLQFISGLPVRTEPFIKRSFFNNGQFKFYFWSGFNSLILNPIPEEIPSFEGNLFKVQLTKKMYDSEILTELRDPSPFSIEEFAAIIKTLLERKKDGAKGDLLESRYANIFYLQIGNNSKGHQAAVLTRCYYDNRQWGFYICDLVGWWLRGDVVFYRR